MAIYTSNFARKGTDPNAISISRKPPSWFKGEQLLILAPTWDMVMGIKKGEIDEEEYTRQYVKILSEIDHDWNRFFNELKDPTYLLCYESPFDFCHRRILAEWLDVHDHWVIPEWQTREEIQAEEDALEKQDRVDNLLTF